MSGFWRRKDKPESSPETSLAGAAVASGAEAAGAHGQERVGQQPQVDVGEGGLGVGGDMTHNAVGAHSQINDNRVYHVHPPAARSQSDAVAYLAEEIARLTVDLKRSTEEVVRLTAQMESARRTHRDEQSTATEKFTALQRKLEGLERELREAVDRASAAETARDEKQRRLDHATRYVQQTEAELIAQRDQAAQLQREIHVLQQQVRLLQHEEAKPHAGGAVSASVPATATQTRGGAAGPPTSHPHGSTTRQRPRQADLGVPSPRRRVRQPLWKADWDPGNGGWFLLLLPIACAVPALALVLSCGLTAARNAEPGPAIWSLVLYAVVALALQLVATVAVMIVLLRCLDLVEGSCLPGCLVLMVFPCPIYAVGLGLDNPPEKLGVLGRWGHDLASLLQLL